MKGKVFDTLLTMRMNPYGCFCREAVDKYWENEAKQLIKDWYINLSLFN